METYAGTRRVDVGFELIDAEHRLQAGLIDSLEDAVRRGRVAEVGEGLMKHLVEYTRAHFQAEALMMRVHDYPREAAHLREHDHLLRQLIEMKRSCQSEGRELTAESVETLRSWLSEHVRGMDRQLADYLREATSGFAPV